MVGHVFGLIMRLEYVGMEGGWELSWQVFSGHSLTLLAMARMEEHLGVCEWTIYEGWHR